MERAHSMQLPPSNSTASIGAEEDPTSPARGAGPGARLLRDATAMILGQRRLTAMQSIVASSDASNARNTSNGESNTGTSANAGQGESSTAVDPNAFVPAMTMSVVFGLVACCSIGGACYLIWCLISDYATGIFGGVLVATVMRHRFDHNVEMDKVIGKATAERRAALRAKLPWWFRGIATPLALSNTMLCVVEQLASLLGFHKYQLLSTPLRQGVGLVCWGIVVSFCLRAFEAFVIVCTVAFVIVITLGWFYADQRMPKVLRGGIMITAGLLFTAVLARELWGEVKLLSTDTRQLAEDLRTRGVKLSDEMIDEIPVKIAQYVLGNDATANATSALLEIADALPSSNASLYERVQEVMRDTQHLATLGTRLRDSDHLSEELLTRINQSLVAGFNVFLSTIVFVLAVFYEMTLFYFTVSFMQAQPHTVTYHISFQFASRVSSSEEVAHRTAKQFEKKVIKSLDSLLFSYAHIVFWSFTSTVVNFRLCSVPYGLFAAMWVTLFSVMPIGVPAHLPHGIAMVWLAYKSWLAREEWTMDKYPFVCANSSVLLQFVAVTVIIYLYGNVKWLTMNACETEIHVKSPTQLKKKGSFGAANTNKKAGEGEVDSQLLTLSFILGYFAFGFRGIVIGPLALVATNLLWQVGLSSGHPDVSNSGGGDAARKEDTAPERPPRRQPSAGAAAPPPTTTSVAANLRRRANAARAASSTK